MIEKEPRGGDVNEPEVPPDATFASFLESTPPGRWVRIVERAQKHDIRSDELWKVALPTARLHCRKCKGTHVFGPMESGSNVAYVKKHEEAAAYRYLCRNCSAWKHFALLAKFEESRVHMLKLGEHLAYGPPVPPRAISLIGPDRELFLRGRRCESQGVGVGAFTYYRRVVDNQWHRLLDAFIRVAEITGSAP